MSVEEEENQALGKILRRFLLENEPGYDSPPYMAFSDNHITLDGKTSLEKGEADLLRSLPKE